MNFVNIASYDNYINANMQLSMLQEEGINCHLKDEHTITIDPLLSPAIGGMKLMVVESQAERARQILDEAETAWLQTVACPSCGQHTLKKVVNVTEYHTLWGKLKSMLANGQEREVKKYYQCSNCQHQFDELPVIL
jgi:DNA-directed RNA polymerase subunit RPC12/RpoP